MQTPVVDPATTTNTTPRTRTEIQKDFELTCMRAGDIQYKIKCFEGELHELNGKLFALNKEVLMIPKEAEPKVMTPDEVISATNDEVINVVKEV